MRINKIVVASALFALLLVACGDDSSTSNDSGKLSNADMEVDSYKGLPTCSEKREGKTAYVVDQEQGYVCKDGEWVEDDDVEEINSAGSGESTECIDTREKNGVLTDCRDGKTYKMVKIGERTWMAENLNYEMANSYCYHDSAKYCDKYGRLYTWAAANNACPEGWRLPSYIEWETLYSESGGYSLSGKMLKSTSGWSGAGNGTDAYGFSALPAGARFDKESYKDGMTGFWSLTEDPGHKYDMSYFALLENTSDRLEVIADFKSYSFSVRCVKDVPIDAVDPLSVHEGSMTDNRDGRTYKTVSIGTQTWMAENLNYEATDSYCYNDSAKYCDKYGRLYTWTVAKDACPSGWHLPSLIAFETLFAAVGDAVTAHRVLRSTSGWNNGNDGSDDYAFAALPAGRRFRTGEFIGEGDAADFWSSTEHYDYSYVIDLDYRMEYARRIDFDRNHWFSIRCLKDDSSEPMSSSITRSSSSKKETIRSSSSMKSGESAESGGTEKGNVPLTLTDERDGQTYKVVSNGSQIWMAENLNYETEESYCYNDSVEYCDKYGRLYTWAAAMDSSGRWTTNGKGCGYDKTCSPTYPVRGVCPDGWHLPTESEFKTLIASIGGTYLLSASLLKSASGWNEKYSIAIKRDAFGFAALPAGLRDLNGSFFGESEQAYFWSSTEIGSIDTYNMFLMDKEPYLDDVDKRYGSSVRCVKDGSSSFVAQSSSSWGLDGGVSSNSESPNAVDPSTVKLGSMTDSRDGQAYRTVTIGTQTWMAENLNYETADSYCYNDSASFCDEFGRLYTWPAAMDSAGVWTTNGKGCGWGSTCSPTYPVRGACPEGWHLPTVSEFETLAVNVGGSSIAGKVLKSTSGWKNDRNGTDAYFFTALPAGNGLFNGIYTNMDYFANFFSSTENGNYNVYVISMSYGNDGVNLDDLGFKGHPSSIRCVKD